MLLKNWPVRGGMLLKKSCPQGSHASENLHRSPRFEPRTAWPRHSPCAGPHALIRGLPGMTVELAVSFRDGRQHLPVVTLNRAA